MTKKRKKVACLPIISRVATVFSFLRHAGFSNLSFSGGPRAKSQHAYQIPGTGVQPVQLCWTRRRFQHLSVYLKWENKQTFCLPVSYNRRQNLTGFLREYMHWNYPCFSLGRYRLNYTAPHHGIKRLFFNSRSYTRIYNRVRYNAIVFIIYWLSTLYV